MVQWLQSVIKCHIDDKQNTNRENTTLQKLTIMQEHNLTLKSK